MGDSEEQGQALQLQDQLSFYISLKKSARKNAEDYYIQARQFKEKLLRLELLEKNSDRKPKPQKKTVPQHKDTGNLRLATSSGKQILIGRNAKQNELLYSRQSRKGDILFHADIIGASLVVLKNGEKASPQELQECAQLAACFSNAWKLGFRAIDVYSFLPEQVEKAMAGLYVGKGSFVILGKKEWHRKTPLKLRLGFMNGVLTVVPDCSTATLEKEIWIIPGLAEKEEFCKLLAERIGEQTDYLASLLPAGKMGEDR